MSNLPPLSQSVVADLPQANIALRPLAQPGQYAVFLQDAVAAVLRNEPPGASAVAASLALATLPSLTDPTPVWAIRVTSGGAIPVPAGISTPSGTVEVDFVDATSGKWLAAVNVSA